MAVNQAFRVTFHFEQSGKRCSEDFQENVIAASSSDFAGISSALSGNGKTNGGHGTLVISSVGHTALGTVLS